MNNEIKPMKRDNNTKLLLRMMSGKDIDETIKNNLCMLCDNTNVIKEFKKEIERKEYSISGMCKKCQDKVFKH